MIFKRLKNIVNSRVFSNLNISALHFQNQSLFIALCYKDNPLKYNNNFDAMNDILTGRFNLYMTKQ